MASSACYAATPQSSFLIPIAMRAYYGSIVRKGPRGTEKEGGLHKNLKPPVRASVSCKTARRF